jgi:hypothetical protein
MGWGKVAAFFGSGRNFKAFFPAFCDALLLFVDNCFSLISTNFRFSSFDFQNTKDNSPSAGKRSLVSDQQLGQSFSGVEKERPLNRSPFQISPNGRVFPQS